MLINNQSECVQLLNFFHERDEHGAYDYLKKMLREDADKYYNSKQIEKIKSRIEKHLVNFRKSAPSSLNSGLMDYPDEFNPISMLTSSLAHGSWSHVIFNLIFFMAFAPAIEIIISNWLRYVALLVALSVITSISYSLVVFIGREVPLPTLGLSGVVMGVIGLSAYLMPKAQVKMFFWFLLFVRTFYLPAWALAAWYIGWDIFDMLLSDGNEGVNLVAHVSGGIAGYIIGFVWFKKRRDEIQDELNAEIESVRDSHQSSAMAAGYSGRRDELKNKQQQKEFKKENDNYMSELHRLVTAKQDSQAIVLILGDYDIQSASIEVYQDLFQSIKSWGNSVTLLCVGRLLVNLLIDQRKYARALVYIEMCQQVTEEFVLANPDNVLLMASMARDNKQYQLAWLLVRDANARYGEYINTAQCALLEIELLWQDLHMVQQARARMKELLAAAEGDFKRNLLKLAILMK